MNLNVGAGTSQKEDGTENTFKDFYDNPYHKEMKYPQFKALEITAGERNGQKTVQVILTK